jgi:hypothetical protein
MTAVKYFRAMGILSIVPREHDISSGDLGLSETGRYPNQLDKIAEEAMNQTGATGAAVVLEKGGDFVCLASAGSSAPPIGTVVQLESGLSGLCLRSGEVLVCDDADADPRVEQDACRTLAIRSIATVPISCNSERKGLVEVFGREPHAFNGGTVETLRKLADEVSSVLQKSAEDLQHGSQPTATSEEPKSSSPRRIKAALAAIMFSAVVLTAIWMLSDLQNPFANASAIPTRVSSSVSDTPMQVPARPTINPASDLVQESAGAPAPLEPDAVRQLADSLAQGADGKQDLIEAYAWYIIAAKNGSKASEDAIRTLTPRMSETEIGEVRFRLGQIFETGDRVPKDLEAAYFWYSLSEAAHSPQAGAEMERVRRLLSSNQVREADLQAADWLARHPATLILGSARSKSP